MKVERVAAVSILPRIPKSLGRRCYQWFRWSKFVSVRKFNIELCLFQILKRQLDQDDDNDLTSLCLYSGIIGSVSVVDMSHPDVNNTDNKTALQQIFDSIMNIHHR